MFNAKYKLKLNKYGNVRHIPNGWIKMPTADTERYENLGIPVYEAVKFKKLKSGYIPIKEKITHRDFRRAVHTIYNKERIKDEADVRRALPERKKILDALCCINNAAKQQRDLMEQAGDEVCGDGSRGDMCGTKDRNALRRFHDAKNMKSKFYQLKDKALKIIIVEWEIKPSGYHVMPGGKKRGYIEVEGYGFHMASKGSKKNLGKCTKPMAASKCGCMPVSTAAKILEAFIAKGSTEPLGQRKAKIAMKRGGKKQPQESSDGFFF